MGFPPQPHPRSVSVLKTPMKILIIQLRRIGDVIVTTPVIDVLRRRFPAARIEFLVEPAAAPVLDHYPGLDERLVFEKSNFWFWLRELRRRRYDWVLDFMNNPRTAQLPGPRALPCASGLSSLFGVWPTPIGCPVPRATCTRFKINSLSSGVWASRRPTGVSPAWRWCHPNSTRSNPGGPRRGWIKAIERVAVMPKHRHEIRQWPAAKFKGVLQRLLTRPGRHIVLVGGADERPYLEDVARDFPERVALLPAGSLHRAAAILSRCHAAVTNDSGLMHLAVAVGTPTVTIYGPTSPGSWNPQRPPHRYLQAQGLACLVCNRDRCPYGHECMEWVSPDQVASETEAVLSSVKRT
jgi:ADP-heptose:LPS heptosyltransferase